MKILSLNCRINNQFILVIYSAVLITITSCSGRKEAHPELLDTTTAVVNSIETDTSAFVENIPDTESLLGTYASDLNASCPRTYGLEGLTLQKVEASGKTITLHISFTPSWEEIFKKSLKNTGGIQNQKSNIILELIQDKLKVNLVNFLIENKCNISYIYLDSNSEEFFQTTISSYDILETFDKLQAQGIEVKPM